METFQLLQQAYGCDAVTVKEFTGKTEIAIRKCHDTLYSNNNNT